MQLIEPLGLPENLARRAEAGFTGLVACRAANATYGLGLVLPVLARMPAFTAEHFGIRVWLTGGEILRGHHLLAMRGHKLAAYVGWAACTDAQGVAFLGEAGIEALDPTLKEAPVIALLTVAAPEPGALGLLRLVMRGMFAGRRYVARRVHAQPLAQPSVARPCRGVILPLAAGALYSTIG